LHNAAFEAMGVDAVSVALRAGAQEASLVVGAVRSLGVRGLSVTMPLKTAVVAACDERTPTVERLGAANCLVHRDGTGVLAASTDGTGLLGAVSCATGESVASMRCAVLGSGGAALAAIDALVGAGAAEVIVVVRRAGGAERALALGACVRVGTADDAAGADLVVQATPVGMEGTPTERSAPLLEPGRLHAGQIAVDLVYHPLVTPWLAQAAGSGARAVGGIEVLIHQAAGALELWLGTPPPMAALHAAVPTP
jgi:shikimate dehydrogenase